MLRFIVPFVIFASTALGNGFHPMSRPVEVRYYYPPTIAYYPLPVATPIYCPVPAVPVMTTVPTSPTQRAAPTFAAPRGGPPTFAVPRAAPPSSSAEPPLSNPARGETKAMRVGELFYDVLPGPTGMPKDGDRCSVAFWNLTDTNLNMKIDGRDVTLLPRKSTTLEVPSTFAWQVAGREAEATRIPAGHPTAEVLIRR